jgi:hypothetical protein
MPTEANHLPPSNCLRQFPLGLAPPLARLRQWNFFTSHSTAGAAVAPGETASLAVLVHDEFKQNAVQMQLDGHSAITLAFHNGLHPSYRPCLFHPVSISLGELLDSHPAARR